MLILRTYFIHLESKNSVRCPSYGSNPFAQPFEVINISGLKYCIQHNYITAFFIYVENCQVWEIKLRNMVLKILAVVSNYVRSS